MAVTVTSGDTINVTVTQSADSSITVSSKGPKGDTGVTGAAGAAGATGATGAAGADGKSYSVSCVDGDNSDEEKIRLTDSDGGTDDVVIEAGTGMSIARSSDKITLTNTVTDTNLTTEAVQDIVGAMFTGNTETGISATYEDGDGTIDLVVSSSQIMTLTGGASVDTRTVEAFISMNYSTADFTSNVAPMKTPLPLACTLGTVAVMSGGDSTVAVVKVYQNESAIFTSASTTWTTAGDVKIFTVNSGSFSAGDTLSFSIDQSSSVDMNYIQATITLNVS